MITFTPNEIKVLSEDPNALRSLSIWHDVQQNCADDQGVDCHGDEIRSAELKAEAARIESEY